MSEALKEQAKTAVRQLVEKYERVKSQERAKEYSEQTTNKDFIMPLFEALGWDVYDKKTDDEVTAEDSVSKKRVDFAFRLNGMAKLFLECKALKVDLEQEKWAEQATNYAHIKGVVWAVLTNFESLKIFNSQLKSESRIIRPILEMNYSEFLARFDDLWLLSRESLETGLIDKTAEGRGQKFKKVPVGEQLLLDLTTWRARLSKDILERNKSKQLSEEDLDESVQRILDRLIFIRKCEDSELEQQNLLLSKVREWEGNPRGFLAKHIFAVFSQFDKDYDSRLFLPHLCDDLEISNQVISEVINGLYHTKDRAIQYDFSAIDADVLGSVYEQYLGHILKKTAKRATVTEKHAHRKEQGIYYTPTYIVDYIVKNTLGELLKTKSPKEAEKIRVLDPACGSGSFLIKTFDVLDKYFKKATGSQQELEFARRSKILTENIYGVDLDPKAVEIAQLNLLLKTAEKKERLPMLQNNIKCGNSLIDDPAIAGNRAFRWDTQFQKIMKQEGGFDAVIGNPPYIRIQTLDKKEVEYFNKKYESPEKNYDIYILFIEQGFKLLKEGGILGFILPHKFFQGENGKNIRSFITKNRALYKIVDFTTNQVFESAATYTCLLFLQKKKNEDFYYARFNLGEDFKNLSKISFDKKNSEILNNDKWNFSESGIQNALNKITSQKNKFELITKKVFKGSSTGNDKIFLLDLVKKDKRTSVVHSQELNEDIGIENELLHPFVYGEDIRRYAPIKSNKLLLFPYIQKQDGVDLIPIDELKEKYPKAFDYLSRTKAELLKRKVELDGKNFYKYSAGRSLSEYNQPKIMIPDMLVSNRISYDEKGEFYHGPAIHSIVFNEEAKNEDPRFYLGILNSKIFWFFIANTSTALRGNTYRLTPEFVNPFCFPKIDLKNSKDCSAYSKMNELVNTMLSLNKRLLEIGDKKTDERARLEEEIKRTDAEIDELVYELYGITDEEKKIIEESLKK